MNDSDTYTELNISELSAVVDDTDIHTDDRNEIEEIDSEVNTIQDSDIVNSEDQTLQERKGPVNNNKAEIVRSTRLPLARIKHIMKMDPDVSIVNAEAVFLVTKATEMFLETIVKETFSYTSQNKRRVISKKDLDVIINKVDCLCFLEGAMDF